ncbi:LPS export ABC transporter periplasmic protein LptC [Roseateles koreensis]|uniref:LPS export ABC transporter periplasmic protein LptC n=1 Tax=Roseateles koreensis TaxID=2987526 RepID=A0ABT5KUW2_9BURK|nr:LPS export ABC transporter periplasmic protein LptC [Roseateles koreensis]MDC8785616.1 LPS export ABC transporter periplasmic protein LptC [Roseateles koreensis]
MAAAPLPQAPLASAISAASPLVPPRPALTPRVVQPLAWRIQAVLTAYLPLILMALLAAGSWWLLKNTPRPDEPSEARAVRHELDYRMRNFDLQKVGADGKLRVRIEGDEMRHYPDTDTLEIDGIHLRATGTDGSLTLARAARAISKADGSEVQLMGSVHVERYDPVAQGAPMGMPKLQMAGEFLHVFVNTETLRSHVPVRISYASGEIQAQSFEYDNLTGQLSFAGQTRGQFTAPAKVKQNRKP